MRPSALSFLKKIFSLEMLKNDICLGDTSKQNAFFSKNKSLHEQSEEFKLQYSNTDSEEK